MLVCENIVIVPHKQSLQHSSVELVLQIYLLVLATPEQLHQMKSGFGFLGSSHKIKKSIKMLLAWKLWEVVEEYFEQKFGDICSFMLFSINWLFQQFRNYIDVFFLQGRGVKTFKNAFFTFLIRFHFKNTKLFRILFQKLLLSFRFLHPSQQLLFQTQKHNMSQDSSKILTTKVEEQTEVKIIQIYNSLVRLGCNLFEPVKSSLIHHVMHRFFQVSDSRLQLIEWLIGTINPYYGEDLAYKNCYHDDPHLHRLKKLSISLWQLGVMPYSKHTKNLDYTKYIEGLLGHQSAVLLIYNLVELANSKFASQLPLNVEECAGDLLGDLISHHRELVNVDYDPYGVTFPPSQAIGQSDEQDNEIEQQYEELKRTLNIQDENEEQEEEENNGQNTSILQEMQKHKQQFIHSYQQLQHKIGQLSTIYNSITKISQEDNQVNNLHKSRTLNIERSLCQIHKEYRNLVSKVKEQNYDADVKKLHEEVVMEIKGLNEINLFE